MIPEVFDMDTWLLAFVHTNVISLGLIVGALYIIFDRLGWKWAKDILDMASSKLGRKSNDLQGTDKD